MALPSLYDARGRARPLPLVGHALHMKDDPLRLLSALARERAARALRRGALRPLATTANLPAIA